ncbi:MAG TPA: hypothetical protein VFH56_06660 [Acidimicrobiales bacterium]|nr:hypothetical protein [Acidimicrobiales bacterium]
MSARKPAKVTRHCDECKYTGSWHYSEDGKQSWRCPNYQAAEQAKVAAAIQHEVNEAATADARRIVADAARRMFEFSSNDIEAEIEAAQLPGSSIGPAFLWAASEKASDDGQLIEPTERFVPSSKPHVRHRVRVWRSRVHPAARRAS